MRDRNGWIVGLLSTTLVAIELVWTRLFSAEFFYTFAFLILSLAVMGLGLGALTLRLSPRLTREGAVGPVLSGAALAALAGPPLVFGLGLSLADLLSSAGALARFVLAVGLLGSTFFLGGMGLAMAFRRTPDRMPSLYRADLLGAGAGVILAVVLMNRAGTPAAAFLCAAPLIGAALLASHGRMRVAAAVLALGMGLLSIEGAGLLEVSREERAPVIYKRWDAMAKVKVYDFGGDSRGINIDNLANTPVFGFDGNWNRPEDKKFEFGIDVANLIGRFPSCTFLSLGAGGGGDVLQALQAGAKEIHAVEVNPLVNRLMLEDDPSGWLPPADPKEEPAAGAQKPDERASREGPGAGTRTVGGSDRAGARRVVPLAEFSGHIYRDPRVRVVTEDARAYVGRFRNKFDMIYSLSSNTFAALASGSFALAENYLFTTEAFRDYWRSMSDGGFTMMEHQYYGPRLVASLMDALRAEGVQDGASHFAVYDLPKMRRKMILLSKRPLDDEIRGHAFGDLTPEVFEDIHLLYPAPEKLKDNLVNRIVLEGWSKAAADAPIDVSPTTDDRPFVGQMGLWKNLTWKGLGKLGGFEVTGFPLARAMIVAILAVVLCFVVPVNLLPFLGGGERLGASSWLYFFVIGVAYMAVEVVLIQKYTLFVGPSAYSVATILLTLLAASGLGSGLAPRMRGGTVFAAIAGWLVLDALLFPYVVHALGGLPMGARILVTAALVAPLGFFMGMPFPKGALRVGDLVDWAFAVTASASVLGAAGILLVAFGWGFRAALLLAAALYVAAFGLLARGSRWTREAGRAPVDLPADPGASANQMVPDQGA